MVSAAVFDLGLALLNASFLESETRREPASRELNSPVVATTTNVHAEAACRRLLFMISPHAPRKNIAEIYRGRSSICALRMTACPLGKIRKARR